MSGISLIRNFASIARIDPGKSHLVRSDFPQKAFIEILTAKQK